MNHQITSSSQLAVSSAPTTLAAVGSNTNERVSYHMSIRNISCARGISGPIFLGYFSSSILTSLFTCTFTTSGFWIYCRPQWGKEVMLLWLPQWNLLAKLTSTISVQSFNFVEYLIFIIRHSWWREWRFTSRQSWGVATLTKKNWEKIWRKSWKIWKICGKKTKPK